MYHIQIYSTKAKVEYTTLQEGETVSPVFGVWNNKRRKGLGGTARECPIAKTDIT